MQPIISIIMGSKSDWETMKKAAQVLEDFGVVYEKKVVSAHRTPDLMFRYAEEARGRGIKVIIAGAGGAAHLPGMVAAKISCFERSGLTLLYRANAWRRACGNNGYRRSGCDQCSALCFALAVC